MSSPVTADAGCVRLPLHDVVRLTHVFDPLILAVLFFHGAFDISICKDRWCPTACLLQTNIGTDTIFAMYCDKTTRRHKLNTKKVPFLHCYSLCQMC